MRCSSAVMGLMPLGQPVWKLRKGRSKRDRSLVTVSAPVALYRAEAEFHLGSVLENGLTKDDSSKRTPGAAFGMNFTRLPELSMLRPA